MFKVNSNDTRTLVFIVNFEHNSDLFLVFILLTLKSVGGRVAFKNQTRLKYIVNLRNNIAKLI